MLYHIFYPLHEVWFGFNVFRYITFRASAAALTAFVFSLVFGGPIIRRLRRLNVGEKIRNGTHYRDLYEIHKNKEGTPTMGGVLIVLALMVATVFWVRLEVLQARLIVLATLWLGSIGFIDDLFKLRRVGGRGLPGRIKLAGQLVFGIAISYYLLGHPETADYAGQIRVPFYKYPLFADIGLFSLLFTVVVIVGTTNAVNITDGLDGLAVGCLAVAALAYAVLCYLTGHFEFAGYLQIIFIPGAGELAVFCAALAGAALGFLWFNSHPAEVFMGDTGALACGGAVGTAAVLINKEFFLLLVGGVFFLEVVSVIIQVASFKLTGKRVFACAPLHHHFEFRGLKEGKITVRFWILAILFAAIGIGALKLQ